jgi:hypothetical protein
MKTAHFSPATSTCFCLSACTTTPSCRLVFGPMKNGVPSSARTELPAAMCTFSPSTTWPITAACSWMKAVLGTTGVLRTCAIHSAALPVLSREI